MEKLAEGFDWSEGPIWMKEGEFLLFSDVPQNVIYRWKEGQGVKEFLKPSGYTGSTPRGGEPALRTGQRSLRRAGRRGRVRE